jgi:hypothetical protein
MSLILFLIGFICMSIAFYKENIRYMCYFGFIMLMNQITMFLGGIS